MAYREADHLRVSQLDFVVGIEIMPSHSLSHFTKLPACPLCEQLKGKYPKTFKFVGWHPNCRCHVNSILKTDEEFDAEQDRLLNGEGEPSDESANRVSEVPDGFKEWVEDNKERMSAWKTQPMFVRDNFKKGRIEEGLAVRGKHYGVDWSDESIYSQARKDNALWASSDPLDEGSRPTVKDADALLRPETGRVWQNASRFEKEAVSAYTWSDYKEMNGDLRSGEDLEGNVQKQIRAMTHLIKDSSLKTDMWVQRGVRSNKNMFNLDLDALTPTQIEKLEGRIVQDKGFLSCGVAKWTGMPTQNTILNIYCPRGTKALYLEPVSAMGKGAGISWDGKSEQDFFGDEVEIVLQRGTRFRISRMYRGIESISGEIKWFADLEVVGQ